MVPTRTIPEGQDEDDKYIPWTINHLTVEYHQKLTEFYNWIMDHHNNLPIRDFVAKNCSHKVEQFH